MISLKQFLKARVSREKNISYLRFNDEANNPLIATFVCTCMFLYMKCNII